MTFEQFLIDHADVVNNFMDSYFDGEKNPDIRKYLYDPLTGFISNAGKRHRPLICMLACNAVGGNPLAALHSAAAIEHFHSAALIHDDIADESLVRRGKPCMYLTEGLGLAINAGDMALSSVMGAVIEDANLSDSVKIRVLTEIVEMDTMTIEGQALDIGWARDKRYDITVDDYLMMATRKTAYYSGAIPLSVGAIIGNGTDEQVSALKEFGLRTGLAFQIQDDLLNLIGTAEATKKDFRSDITEGKRTFAAVHAIQNSPDKDELIAILDSKTTDTDKLDRAVQIMTASGSIEAAKSYAMDLMKEVMKSKPYLDMKEQLRAEQSEETAVAGMGVAR